MLKPTCLHRLALAAVSLTVVATCSSLKVYRIRKLDFPNKSGRLANGMRVVIQPDPSVPYAIAVMRYEVGAGFDPPEKKGLAHLVEHLAFRLGDELVDLEEATPVAAQPDAASPQPDDEKRDDDQKKSSKVRVLKYIVTENAYTTLDETVYWKRVVPLHLGDVLDDFAAQMGDFSGKISEDIFETERKVVRNERRSSYEGQPLDRVVLDLYERIYPEGHPYQGHAVIGSHETIAAIELTDVAAFLEKHYHPGNATLSIVGPVDAEETLQMVIKKFGDKPKRPESTPVVPDWQPFARRETVIVPKAKQTMVTVAWPLGPEFSDEVEAMRILRDRGWFWWRLVSNRDIAYWVTSGLCETLVPSGWRQKSRRPRPSAPSSNWWR